MKSALALVEKLKPGMTRSQEKFLLGTPLVVDPFRNDRWDYVYLYYKAGELAEQRRISVIFDKDKLKRVDGDVRVLDTPDRSTMWQAQTPQVFPAEVLRAAYADPAAEATDDAALVERTRPGFTVRMVDAGASNLKVTRAEDLVLAEAILRSRASGPAT